MHTGTHERKYENGSTLEGHTAEPFSEKIIVWHIVSLIAFNKYGKATTA